MAFSEFLDRLEEQNLRRDEELLAQIEALQAERMEVLERIEEIRHEKELLGRTAVRHLYLVPPLSEQRTPTGDGAA